MEWSVDLDVGSAGDGPGSLESQEDDEDSENTAHAVGEFEEGRDYDDSRQENDGEEEASGRG